MTLPLVEYVYFLFVFGFCAQTPMRRDLSCLCFALDISELIMFAEMEHDWLGVTEIVIYISIFIYVLFQTVHFHTFKLLKDCIPMTRVERRRLLLD